ncbi:response regulator [Sediminibacterium soli]|uniref:response regulator n=1 Tax=Sediminibacterium soli TaxID=2698829 RepID=UPI0013798E34|nr:response regulator [Sediminibacterium soli]NCI45541.1 response regulator [Sediminibacterium soli]
MEKHILLIDDDLDEPEMFMNALFDADIICKCTWANGAEEAFRHLEHIRPDFIVLDFNMPKMNGLDTLRALKAHEEWQAIPVVMYSTTMDSTLSAKALQQGAVQCIRKPYNMKELPTLLQAFL